MRNLLNKYKVEWPESDKLEMVDFEINRLIEKLDDLAIKYEARWGVYRLESLASSELSAKWQRQVDKINAAIQTKNLRDLEALVEGAAKGYALLEEEALKNGHKPCTPEFWEIRKGTKIYRVVTNAAAAKQIHKPENKDVTILTLEEVVNIYDKKHTQTFGLETKTEIPESDTGFNYVKGDTLPF